LSVAPQKESRKEYNMLDFYWITGRLLLNS